MIAVLVIGWFAVILISHKGAEWLLKKTDLL